MSSPKAERLWEYDDTFVSESMPVLNTQILVVIRVDAEFNIGISCRLCIVIDFVRCRDSLGDRSYDAPGFCAYI